MATSQHMDHESAAFNVALGVLLLSVALNTRRAVTRVPVLASFVGVLAIASVFDLADGAVALARLATVRISRPPRAGTSREPTT
jgi:predicted anti-sigma-YlaC factor YlaD